MNMDGLNLPHFMAGGAGGVHQLTENETNE